jgi:16S rRNA (cytosine1402-N4)-methyltransferase
MATEVVDLFRPLGGGLIVDATFGGGGHSTALLAAIEHVDIVGIDRDPDALRQAMKDPRIRLAQGRFSDLGRLVAELTGRSAVDDESGNGPIIAGVLFDLGVSSHQLDTPSRGFSYQRAGPLDMRMNPDAELSAGVVVNSWAEQEIAGLIRRYGDERFARRIAHGIVASRPLASTAALAKVIADSVPAAARRKRHPARRTFQAIRIAVNDELTELKEGLDAALAAVRPGGRVIVITYHSIEDRIVAHRFASGTTGCDCPPDFPVCMCGRTAQLRSLTRRGLTSSEAEIERNPRARSARLRAVESVAA